VKRLLWVTPIEPRFEAGGGGEIRQAHLIAALAERFEVHLLLAGRLTDERVQSLLGSVREVPASPAVDPPGRMRRRLRDIRWEILQRSSDEVARQRGLRRALSAAIASGPPAELVCVEYVGLAPLIPRAHRGFWSLTLHNLPSQMARHNAAIAPGRRQRFMLGFEERNSRRVEHWALRAYDLVVAVSPEDAAALPAGAVVVPNGVETTRLSPTPLPCAPRVVFTGALHTLPNRDGIAWFCREVWPAVRERIPEAELSVVGARPPDEILALAELEGVSVHPDVPDVAPFLEAARVAVVPLRIGSGSRLKALEAMAAARPVVGTRIGLGGLEAELDRDALAADEPGAFAEALARCLTDDALARRLASNGRRLVEERYSWRRIGAGYASLLADRAGA